MIITSITTWKYNRSFARKYLLFFKQKWSSIGYITDKDMIKNQIKHQFNPGFFNNIDYICKCKETT